MNVAVGSDIFCLWSLSCGAISPLVKVIRGGARNRRWRKKLLLLSSNSEAQKTGTKLMTRAQNHGK